MQDKKNISPVKLPKMHFRCNSSEGELIKELESLPAAAILHGRDDPWSNFNQLGADGQLQLIVLQHARARVLVHPEVLKTYPGVITAVRLGNYTTILIWVGSQYEIFIFHTLTLKEMRYLFTHDTQLPNLVELARKFLFCILGPKAKHDPITYERYMESQSLWSVYVAYGFDNLTFQRLKENLESLESKKRKLQRRPTRGKAAIVNDPNQIFIPTDIGTQTLVRAINQTHRWIDGTFKCPISRHVVTITDEERDHKEVLQAMQKEVLELDTKAIRLFFATITYWVESSGFKDPSHQCTLPLSKLIALAGGGKNPNNERMREWLKQFRLLTMLKVEVDPLLYKKEKKSYEHRKKHPLLIWLGEESIRCLDTEEIAHSITFGISRYVFETLGGPSKEESRFPAQFIKASKALLKKDDTLIKIAYGLLARERIHLRKLLKGKASLCEYKMSDLLELIGVTPETKNLGRTLDRVVAGLNDLLKDDVLKSLVITGDVGSPKERFQKVVISYRMGDAPHSLGPRSG